MLRDGHFLTQCFNLNTAVSGADMLTAGQSRMRWKANVSREEGRTSEEMWWREGSRSLMSCCMCDSKKITGEDGFTLKGLPRPVNCTVNLRQNKQCCV